MRPVAPSIRNEKEFATLAEPHRRELRVHCYRMLGSLQDAEDLVQESFLRAWQHLDRYEGRATFRTWLYKIATNACLDTLAGRPKRALPPQRSAPSDPAQPPAPPAHEPIWLEPFPDELLADADDEPAARYGAHESITLAFLAALQLLPPRQRAVLILRDVLDWQATEVAQLLDLSVSAVNSALHRARVTMAKHYRAHRLESLRTSVNDEKTRTLLERYVRAWEAADIDQLIGLLKEDASFAMPPFPSWYQGRAAIRAMLQSGILAGDARGRWRLIPTRANGQPAFGWYQRAEANEEYGAFGIQVLNVDGGGVADTTTFPTPVLFPFFKLPPTIHL